MSAPAEPQRPWYDRPLKLGSPGGIPVALSTSWVLISVGMIALFAPRLRSWLPGIGWGAAAGIALLYVLILAVSVLLHEVAHAVAARAVGWQGASIEITLWGGHTSFHEVHSTPGRSLLVSLVGPAVNLVLGGLGLLVQHTLDPLGVTGLLLWMGVWSNLAVGLFNLLPGLPLDGGRLVESAAWAATGSRAKGEVAAGWAGRVIVVIGVLGAIGYWLARHSIPDLLPVVVLVVVLLPLWTGAGQAIEHGSLRVYVEGLRVPELMVPAHMMPPHASVADAEAAGLHAGAVILAREPGGGRLLRVMPEAAASVPEAAKAGTPVERAGVSADDAGVVGEDADGDTLVAAVAGSVSGTVLVTDTTGRCIGAVRQEDVIAALQGHDRKELTP